jgi:hypothetical protein
MRHPVVVGLFTALVVLAGSITASAQQFPLSSADVTCRQEIGKRAKKLADTLLKEKIKCHKLRMKGAITLGTNCNSPTDPFFPGGLKVANAQAKMDEKVATKCAAASSPFSLGYVLCPTPCESITISGFTGPNSVASCIICQMAPELVGLPAGSGFDATALFAGYGANPPAPLPTNDLRYKCQNNIGSAMRKLVNSRVKEQQKCQIAGDATTQLETVCQVAQTGVDEKVTKAITKARATVGKCNPGALANLPNTCSPANLDGEKDCIQAASLAYADSLFHAIYYAEPHAIFVSSTVGSPSGTGTVFSPIDTIQGGITLALSNSTPDIFIDGGSYNGQITLQSGIHLKGGFNSSLNWVNDGSITAAFSATTNGMLGTSVSNTTVEQLKVSSAGTFSTGQSSYGVRLISPSNVTIKNCTIVSGNAGNGTGGSNGGGGNSGNIGGNGGNGCEGSTYLCSTCGRPGGGGGGTNPSCSSGSTGGAGGAAGHCSTGDVGQAGQAGAGTNPGGGGPGGGGCHGVPGAGGSAGNVASGSNGGGAANFGSASSLYTPANGGNGTNGATGSGGGGGGGGGGGDAGCDSYGGGGGGGGSGGCGGTFATGGTGAGGSFGVWISGGTATIQNTAIQTGTGGTGGSGGVGGNGGSGVGGGFGGSGEDDSIPGKNGGSGGNGGNGGHGGGGGGGPSVGIVCSGASVVRSGNTFTLGNAGGGGSSSGNAGATGLHVNENGC